MTKKVLLSAYACSPNMGSEEGTGWNWALNLQKLGFDVYCITSCRHRNAIEEEMANLKLERLHFIFVDLGPRLDLLNNPSTKSIYVHYYLWRRKAGKLAEKMHKSSPFDVAHHVTYGSLQQGSFIWKLADVTQVFGPIGGGQTASNDLKYYFEEAWRFEVVRNIVSAFMMKLNSDARQTLKSAGTILVTNRETETLINQITKGIGHKIKLEIDNAVPLQMETNRMPAEKTSGKLKLLWVGRILPRKGLNLVLHALSFLRGSIDYELTIVGSGEWYNKIPKWIAKYGLDPKRIVAVGKVPYDRVISYYENSDVFIFCSLRDSCGAQLMEAMSFGVPVITLNTNGAALAVPETAGIKVDVAKGDGTAQLIAQSIDRLYSDPALRVSLAKGAFEHASDNHWNAKIKRISEQFY